jgi:hypothetical protein
MNTLARDNILRLVHENMGFAAHRNQRQEMLFAASSGPAPALKNRTKPKVQYPARWWQCDSRADEKVSTFSRIGGPHIETLD